MSSIEAEEVKFGHILMACLWPLFFFVILVPVGFLFLLLPLRAKNFFHDILLQRTHVHGALKRIKSQ